MYRNSIEHPRIDLRPVGHDFLQRGTPNQAVFRARILVAHAVVKTIEEDAKARIERLETGLELFQHEGFKKPAQVRQMPFGRTGIRHGLELAIFGAQRLNKPLGLHTNLLKALRQVRRWKFGDSRVLGHEP